MNWDRFFLYLGRFNTIAISCTILVFAGFAIIGWVQDADRAGYSERNAAGFGSDRASQLESKIAGQEIVTSDGVLAAYYHATDGHERDDLGGLTLVNPTTGKSLEIGTGPDELVIGFDFLFDQENSRNVVGYVARIADRQQYSLGTMDLVVGALPEMNRAVAARDIRYTDFPVLVGNDALAAILWTEEDKAEYASFSLSTGKVIERKSIRLPMLKPDRLSMGPGTLSGSSLRGQLLAEGDDAPVNRFAF